MTKLFQPREYSPGMWLRLFLERAGRSQKDLANALNTRVRKGLLQTSGRGRDWLWKVWNLAKDERPLEPSEYVAVAEELGLSLPDRLRFLRSADIYPTPSELVDAIRSARYDLDTIPWPAYVISYRLEFLAWNRVTARLYGLGAEAAGPDLPQQSLSGQARSHPQYAQGILEPFSILFDAAGPLRMALSHAPDEWKAIARQQLALAMSYWEPLRVWGDPSWLKGYLENAERFPEFKELWGLASADRLAQQTGTDLQIGTTRSDLFDHLRMSFGGKTVLLNTHEILLDPRLEMVVQDPLDRKTATAFLQMEALARD